MGTRVVTDSTSYLPPEAVRRFGIDVVQLSVTFGDVTATEREWDVADLFRRVAESGGFPTSSQPSVADMVDAFEGPAAAGDEVVAVLISSRMSGTFESAHLARSQVLERHPDARIEIVDSRSNSMQEGFAVLAAARAAEAGGNAASAAAAARKTTARTRWVFSPPTLEYLRRGGRIGDASALLGSLLQICPVLTVADGVTAKLKPVRTHRKALEAIVGIAARDLNEHGYVDAVVHHAICPDEAAVVAAGIEAATGHAPQIVALGPAVAVHVGPGSLGVVYECREPLDGRGGEAGA